MSLSRLHFAAVCLLVGIQTAACSADAGDDSVAGSSDVSKKETTPAEAVKRILELAPANGYDGTARNGDTCSVLVEDLGRDHVNVTVHSTDCAECADVRGKMAAFTVHPEISGFDMGGSPATPIAKWTNKKDGVSFAVTNEDDRNGGYVAIEVSITDLTSEKAALKIAVGGGEPIECTKLKGEPKWDGVH